MLKEEIDKFFRFLLVSEIFRFEKKPDDETIFYPLFLEKSIHLSNIFCAFLEFSNVFPCVFMLRTMCVRILEFLTCLLFENICEVYHSNCETYFEFLLF